MKILITGMAGFIGMHLANKLLQRDPGCEIVGMDNLNDYYDVNLKYGRLGVLGFARDEVRDGVLITSKTHPNCRFEKLDLRDGEALKELFRSESFDYVVNLAAQAGVRYSLVNPQSYIDSNITGLLNVLEACRAYPVKHLVYASSSSVYGLNEKTPFSEEDRVDSPASLYAATKKASEMMAHTYAHLFKIPASGLRFFTVYGEWGRPDMSPYIFVSKILRGEPIQLFNNGKMRRDFTYVGDIVEGVADLLPVIPQGVPCCEVYNIGNNQPVELETYVATIEKVTGRKAKRELLPMQKGDVLQTYADVSKLMRVTGFKPDTPLETGLARFVQWYRDYYDQIQ